LLILTDGEESNRMSKPSNIQGVPPPFNLLVQATEAATEMHQLVSLDSIWSAAERQGDHELSGRDREALVGLAAKLDLLLASVERHAETLHHLCSSHSEWFNKSIRSALGGEQFTDDDRAKALALIGADGDDYAARGATLATSLAKCMPIEREELRGKVPALRGEGPVVTDISHDAACKALAASMMVELAICIPTDGAGCVMALGTMIAAAAIDCH
jgi:hypothetical protein